MNTRNRVLVTARALALLVCVAVVSTGVEATTRPHRDSLVARLGGIENIARPYPWLLTGGQPDARSLAVLAEAGVTDVFDLRFPSEPRGLEERAVAESLGLRYLAIPTGAADFRDSRFTAFRHHLIAHGPENPMFVHCATGNRVGAALLPWLVLDEGMSDDLALAMARQMGLRDPDLTRRAWEYIRAHEPPKPVK
jgi:protein tyrosine phosphatase (PTP) superfamily phosphohydrolase (DUF442 family)